jgi:ATP-dependent DNA helicase RecQ
MELYDWQREAIDVLVEGSGQVLVVAPTGGGKSMCYQQPASQLEGVALVITPLVSLMVDQVASLTDRNIPATYLASNLDMDEQRRRELMAIRGEVKLLYVAPERLASERFVEGVIAKLPLSLIAVDEAHCISHWGHDFRPDYLQLGALVQRLHPPRVLACTATATPAVRKEIVERLHMPDAHQVLQGFARPNLELAVEEASGPKTKEQRILAEVKRVLQKPGAGNGSAIVYTSQRKHAEDVAEALRHAGWRADHYHAGMEGDARKAVQERFQAGSLDVVAATNAFGMGIDRSDIRLVIHHAITETLEAYYQEVGRAGRDGQPARGLLLLSDPDIAWRFRLIQEEPDLAPEYALHRRNMLRAMVAYAETSACRHDEILRYFEDEAEELGGCGHCDNCRARAAGQIKDELSPADSSQIVRKALTAIRSLPFAAGPGNVAAFLIGNPSKQIQKHDWHRRPQFGALRERNEDWTKRLLRRLIATGLVAVDGERQTLQITRRGAEVDAGSRDNPVQLPPERNAVLRLKPSSRAGKAPIPDEQALDGNALDLMERLRQWRITRATKLNLPAYGVLPDVTLRALAATQPATKEQLLDLSGFGPVKVEKYGEDVLKIVAQHVREHGHHPIVVEGGAASPQRSFNDERIAEARKTHPRAFEKWSDEEDGRLRGYITSGRKLDEIVGELQRQPNAIRLRAERLELATQLVE